MTTLRTLGLTLGAFALVTVVHTTAFTNDAMANQRHNNNKNVTVVHKEVTVVHKDSKQNHKHNNKQHIATHQRPAPKKNSGPQGNSLINISLPNIIIR